MHHREKLESVNLSNLGFPLYLLPLSEIESVDWRYEGYFDDKRAVIFLRSGTILVSSPFPDSVNVLSVVRIVKEKLDGTNPETEIPQAFSAQSNPPIEWKQLHYLKKPRITFHFASGAKIASKPMTADVTVGNRIKEVKKEFPGLPL